MRIPSSVSILMLQVLAFWPVWRWYALRVADGSDEPFGVFALAIVGLYLFLQGRTPRLTTFQIWLALPLTVFYIGTYSIMPPLIRSIAALSAMGIIMSGWLGAVNYGVIVSNEVDKLLTKPRSG